MLYRFSICCIADLQSAGRGIGRARGRFPTTGRVQLCDTAQRGEAPTKGARVCDPQELCWPPSVLTNPARRSLSTCCGSQSRAPQNRRCPRRFGQITPPNTRSCSLFSFPDMNVSVEGLEPNFRASAVDGADDAFVKHDAVSAAFLAPVFHGRLAGSLVEPDLKIAVNVSVLRFQFDVGFRLRRQCDVNVAIERAERH